MSWKLIKRKILMFCIKHASWPLKSALYRKICAHVGENCMICNGSFANEPYLVWIGDNVTVASNVSFITHDHSYFHAYEYLGKDAMPEGEKMGGIILHDGCFIGSGSILLFGTEVGENSIVAAGSIVKSNIPNNEVWGGCPAHFIKTLDEYCNEIVSSTNQLPWVEMIKSGQKLSEQELIQMRQSYYLHGALATVPRNSAR